MCNLQSKKVFGVYGNYKHEYLHMLTLEWENFNFLQHFPNMLILG